MPRYIKAKLTKDKKRILNTAREKINSSYTRDCQSRILYPAKLSFKTEGEIKAFPDQQKLRDSVTTRTSLQETFKGVLQVKVKEY